MQIKYAILQEYHLPDPPNQLNTTSSVLPSNLATHTHSIPHSIPLSHITSSHREKLRGPALLSKIISIFPDFLPGELNSHHWCQAHAVHRLARCSTSIGALEMYKERYSSFSHSPLKILTVERLWEIPTSHPNLHHSGISFKWPRTAGQPLLSSVSPCPCRK